MNVVSVTNSKNLVLNSSEGGRNRVIIGGNSNVAVATNDSLCAVTVDSGSMLTAILGGDSDIVTALTGAAEVDVVTEEGLHSINLNGQVARISLDAGSRNNITNINDALGRKKSLLIDLGGVAENERVSLSSSLLTFETTDDTHQTLNFSLLNGDRVDPNINFNAIQKENAQNVNFRFMAGATAVGYTYLGLDKLIDAMAALSQSSAGATTNVISTGASYMLSSIITKAATI